MTLFSSTRGLPGQSPPVAPDSQRGPGNLVTLPSWRRTHTHTSRHTVTHPNPIPHTYTPTHIHTYPHTHTHKERERQRERERESIILNFLSSISTDGHGQFLRDAGRKGNCVFPALYKCKY